MSGISELEGVVLGMVGDRQPCTAYQIRQALKLSPSTHWSGSAGAIYPLLERLVARGHMQSKPDPRDGRGRSLLSLTRKGKRALRSWILKASAPEVAGAIFDAVRTRAFFLGSLSPQDREKFATATLRALESFLDEAAEFEARLPEGAELDRLASRGAVLAARSRVQWMNEILDHLRASTTSNES